MWSQAPEKDIAGCWVPERQCGLLGIRVVSLSRWLKLRWDLFLKHRCGWSVGNGLERGRCVRSR